jgi:hypothetical protein
MIHPDTALVRIDETVGYGLVATRPLPRGTLTWVQDALDQVMPPEHWRRLPAAYADLIDRYTYGDAQDNRILIWDLGRQMNHSCAPNCFGTLFGFEVALRDIAAGEQLTNDYGTLFQEPHEGFACTCGAPGCRGTTGAPLTPAQLAQLRDMLRDALEDLPRRPQPLGALLHPDTLLNACRDLGANDVLVMSVRDSLSDSRPRS